MEDENNRAADADPRGRSRLHRLMLALPPETAHSVAVTALRLAQVTPARRWLEGRYCDEASPRLSQTKLLGLDYSNPIGLAAGFDKDGLVVPGMAALGFGWLEIGAVTPRPQKGNQRPRLFRHSAAASLENAMGFNNQGCRALCRRLESFYPARIPLFVNLGKNRDTPNAGARDDYLFLIESLEGRCDGFVLNVSSPNTPGLRDLQRAQTAGDLVRASRAATSRPLLIKLSPDLSASEALEIADASVGSGADGIVLTNTTTDYQLLASARGVGGLSGRVLRERSLRLLEAVAGSFFGRCLLVSVGGVSSGADVYARLRAGAGLVQLYTALVFEGPGLIARIRAELIELLARDGLDSIVDAIGADLAPPAADRRAG